MVSADGPARVLAGAVRFLPKGRREWGRAMRAELAAIAPDGGRWRFVLSCLRVVAAQRLAPRALGYLLLGSAVLAGVVALTSPIGYPPLRRGLVGLVAVLVAGSGLAGRRWLLGAAGAGGVARLVGAGGYLVVGALALSVVLDMRGPVPNPGETASAGVPINTLLLTVYLVGFLAVTARRCAATGRVLAHRRRLRRRRRAAVARARPAGSAGTRRPGAGVRRDRDRHDWGGIRQRRAPGRYRIRLARRAVRGHGGGPAHRPAGVGSGPVRAGRPDPGPGAGRAGPRRRPRPEPHRDQRSVRGVAGPRVPRRRRAGRGERGHRAAGSCPTAPGGRSRSGSGRRAAGHRAGDARHRHLRAVTAPAGVSWDPAGAGVVRLPS